MYRAEVTVSGRMTAILPEPFSATGFSEAMLEKSRLNEVADVWGRGAALGALLDDGLGAAADEAWLAAEDGDEEVPVPELPHAAATSAVVARIDVKASFLMTCKGVLLTIDCDRRPCHGKPGAAKPPRGEANCHFQGRSVRVNVP